MTGFAFNVKGSIDSQKIKDLMGPSTDVLTGYLDNQPNHPAKQWTGAQLELVKKYRPWWIGKGKPISMVTLAKYMTYGSSTYPARPFLEEGIGHDMNALSNEIEHHYRGVQDGRQDRATSLKRLGAFLIGQVKLFMVSDVYKSSLPNAELTKMFKGSDQPLIDTGLLMQAVQSEIRKGVSVGAEE